MPSAERTASQSKDPVFADFRTAQLGSSCEGPRQHRENALRRFLCTCGARGPSTPRLVRSANQPLRSG